MSRAKTTPTRSFVHVGCARLFYYRSCEVAEVAAPSARSLCRECRVILTEIIARSMQLMRVASDLTQTFRPCLTP